MKGLKNHPQRSGGKELTDLNFSLAAMTLLPRAKALFMQMD